MDRDGIFHLISPLEAITASPHCAAPAESSASTKLPPDLTTDGSSQSTDARLLCDCGLTEPQQKEQADPGVDMIKGGNSHWVQNYLAFPIIEGKNC